MFVRDVNSRYGCSIVSSTGETLVPHQYSGSIEGAFHNAYKIYKTTPNKKSRVELASENESLRQALKRVQPVVEDDEGTNDEATESGDPPAAPGDDAPAPVRPSRKKARRKPMPKV